MANDEQEPLVPDEEMPAPPAEDPPEEDEEPNAVRRSIDTVIDKINGVADATRAAGSAGAKAAVGSISDMPAFAAQPVQKATSLAHRRIEETVEKLTNNRELLRAAGFKLQRLEVELGIPPKLIPRFSVEKKLDAEERAAVLKKIQGKRLIRGLLKGLFEAADLSEAVKICDMSLLGVEVELGSIPRVRMLFR